MGLGNLLVTFRWPWSKVTTVASISTNLLVCMIKWKSLIRSLQNMVGLLPLVMVITWLDCGEILLKTVILANFLYKISYVFFSRPNTILGIFQEWLVQLMWKKKGVHQLDTGYNMWPWPLTSLMTLTLDVSRSNFEIAVSQGLLVDVKWKGIEIIEYWVDCMTLPFDHTHDLDLRVSRSESEIALSQEWGSWFTWKVKDVSHTFMTMILTSVTMVGWADVPDNVQGDFRSQRAIDISSFYTQSHGFENDKASTIRRLIR